jgi:hypothetical protein
MLFEKQDFIQAFLSMQYNNSSNPDCSGNPAGLGVKKIPQVATKGGKMVDRKAQNCCF